MLQEEEEVNQRLKDKAVVQKLQDKVDLVSILLCQMPWEVLRAAIPKSKLFCLAVYV